MIRNHTSLLKRVNVIVCVSSTQLSALEDSHNGIATVLKTVGVKPVDVRVVYLPQTASGAMVDTHVLET